MRKGSITIADVKEKINELVGKNIHMQVCRGRKKISKYNGVLENTFPSVFVVALENTKLTYSYSDIVCGEVVILPTK